MLSIGFATVQSYTIFVYTVVRMKNVTLSADEDLIEQARQCRPLPAADAERGFSRMAACNSPLRPAMGRRWMPSCDGCAMSAAAAVSAGTR